MEKVSSVWGTFQEVPTDLEGIIVKSDSASLFDILKQCLPDASNTEIKRLVSQNGVKIDNQTKNMFDEIIPITANGVIIKVGKKKWFKIAS